MQSLSIRLDRFALNPLKDELKNKKLFPHLNNLKSLEKTEFMSDDALESVDKYREMIAEYRISVFSPEIKTSLPVSSKKLQKQWQAVMEKC